MNKVKCTIPADLLRYTATALTELAIRKRSAANRKPAPEMADLLEQAAAVQKAADYFSDLYQQRSKDKEAQA